MHIFLLNNYSLLELFNKLKVLNCNTIIVAILILIIVGFIVINSIKYDNSNTNRIIYNISVISLMLIILVSLLLFNPFI